MKLNCTWVFSWVMVWFLLFSSLIFGFLVNLVRTITFIRVTNGCCVTVMFPLSAWSYCFCPTGRTTWSFFSGFYANRDFQTTLFRGYVVARSNRVNFWFPVGSFFIRSHGKCSCDPIGKTKAVKRHVARGSDATNFVFNQFLEVSERWRRISIILLKNQEIKLNLMILDLNLMESVVLYYF